MLIWILFPWNDIGEKRALLPGFICEIQEAGKLVGRSKSLDVTERMDVHPKCGQVETSVEVDLNLTSSMVSRPTNARMEQVTIKSWLPL